MSNLNFKYLFLFLTGFIFLDFPSCFLISLRAEEFNELNLQVDKININYEDLKLSKKNINRNINSKLSNSLKKDLLNSMDNLINLIALEDNLNKNNFTIDIESDNQYEKENIYYAQGNVIVNFSNALIKGDSLIYDKSNKSLKIIGKVVFIKGSQYFEASEVFYDLKKEEGYIDNIYGILDFNNFIIDYELKNIKEKRESYAKGISELQYIESVKVGLENDISKSRKLNLTNISFDVPAITKWRYKAKKLIIKDKILESKRILFTNDAINEPQFILESQNFTGEILDNKIKLISKKNWIILDDKLKMPIGKRTIYDDDPITSWGLGSDYKEKDGFYISNQSSKIELNNDFYLKLRPYILIQRGVQGSSNSFRAKNQSIFSNKVKNNIKISDLFAIDMKLIGNMDNWDFYWDSRLNSLNLSRFHEALRSKLQIKKTIDLNSSSYKLENDQLPLIQAPQRNESNKIKIANNLVDFETYEDFDRDYENKNIKRFRNLFDLKFTTAYREKILKGYSGESEVYFGNSLTLANRRLFTNNDGYKNLYLIYDFGNFKSKSKRENNFSNLNRNVFALKYRNSIALWKNKASDKYINQKNIFTPYVVNQGINWISNFQSGLFLYSDGSSQKAISLSMGPKLIFGNHKNQFFDYSQIKLTAIKVLKDGESPFEFDDINKNFRLDIQLKQQVVGPLVFSYNNSYDFDNEKYSLPRYSLDINRRAYSLGAFYNKSNKSVGINFNIYNFDYNGYPRKFKSK